MLRVRCCDPRFARRGLWSGTPAAMQLATAPTFNGGVLARRAFARFRMAPLARPVGAEPRTTAGINELFAVS